VPSNSTYYLRVRTKDNGGNWAGWTTLFTFKYDATAPTNPSAGSVNPGCTATSGVWQNTCGDPNFTWSGGTDGGSGVAGYEVYWGTSISGTTPATWVTSPAYNPSAVPSESTYYLRVRTQDNAGNWAGWVTLFTFKYDGTAPTSPTPAAVNPGCSAGDGVCQNTCGDPNFTWGAWNDPGSGVAGYEVYWGTAITGTSPATWTTTPAYNPPAVPSEST
jgi:hypothetical protein